MLTREEHSQRHGWLRGELPESCPPGFIYDSCHNRYSSESGLNTSLVSRAVFPLRSALQNCLLMTMSLESHEQYNLFFPFLFICVCAGERSEPHHSKHREVTAQSETLVLSFLCVGHRDWPGLLRLLRLLRHPYLLSVLTGRNLQSFVKLKT